MTAVQETVNDFKVAVVTTTVGVVGVASWRADTVKLIVIVPPET